jgi:hypothetical protein
VIFRGFGGFFSVFFGFRFFLGFGLKSQIFGKNWAFQKGGICGAGLCVYGELCSVLPLFSVRFFRW